jgi:four helix bundle protein
MRWFGMADFKKLDVWQRAHALSLSIDRACKRIRASQYYSLRNQIFTAALSIPANIAEGPRKTSEKEFVRFLRIALSSTSELESHLLFAQDAEVITKNEAVALIGQTILIRKMLYALIKRVLSTQPPAAPLKAPGR